MASAIDEPRDATEEDLLAIMALIGRPPMPDDSRDDVAPANKAYGDWCELADAAEKSMGLKWQSISKYRDVLGK